MKFPLEFDALDLATDELKAKLLPVSRKLKEVEKERTERRKVRKRTKTVPSSSASTSTAVSDAAVGNAATDGTRATGDVEMADAAPASTEVKGGDLEAESVYREKEAKELAELVDPSVKSDVGCSATGLYDLVGTSFHFIHFVISICNPSNIFLLATSVSILTTLSVHLTVKACKANVQSSSSHRNTQRRSRRRRALHRLREEERIPRCKRPNGKYIIT